MSQMERGESIPVLGSFFKLTYIHNPGAVFGFTLGGRTAHLLFALVAMGVVLAMLLRFRKEHRWARVGLALVLGGAIGNVVDRIRFGEVVDFLDFGIPSFRWFVFNVADACVTVGAGLLLLYHGFRDHPEGDKGPTER